MYRVHIKDNDTPQFNYPTPVVKYLYFDDYEMDYDMLIGLNYLYSLSDEFGEGCEYQLVII